MHIFYIIFFILFFGVFGGVLFGVGWFPTKKKDYERIASLVNLSPGTVFYDLGSGSGEMLFYLSKKYNIKCAGIEISPFLYCYSKIKSLFYNNVKIYYGNFFNYSLSKAEVVYVFLIPSLYNKLKKKINNELKDGSMVIFSCWPLERIAPCKTSKEKNSFSYYLYKKPL